MAIRKFKPYTPGTRQRVVTDFSEITSAKPERSLIVSKHRVKAVSYTHLTLPTRLMV